MKISNHATHCLVCNVELNGKKTKFCSRQCKGKCGNSKHQNYKKQQIRGLKRKLMLIEKSGGACTKCGYCKCTSALSFHHIDPNQKKQSLDLRSLSNTNMETIMEEYKKCELLCLNCHAELHWPNQSQSSLL